MHEIELKLVVPEAARARAAAYIITASEGAALHLDRLKPVLDIECSI